MNKLRIGTRGSPLALKQTDIFIQKFQEISPQEVEIVTIKTTGDIVTDRSLADLGGKALFYREIEQALFKGEIDCAVHSLKDLEGTIPLDTLGAILERADPRDALVSTNKTKFKDLPYGARIGTCSPRRGAQLRVLRPDIEIYPIRGNVGTRIKAILEENRFDGTLLAVAGLDRLNLTHVISEIFDLEAILPAIGQGAIAVQIRPDNIKLRETLIPLNHGKTIDCMLAERTVINRIKGDCRTPIAAYATYIDDVTMSLRARFWRNGQLIEAHRTGINPLLIGEEVASILLGN